MRYLLGVILPFFVWGICQAEIVTVAKEMAEVLSKPSIAASYVVIQAPRYYPLSVKGERNDFYEVRDYEGRTGWIHKSLVDNTKGVVVEVGRVNVRQGPGTGHPVAFMAYQGVTFKVLGEEEGWLEIMHETGKRGWVFKALTWGQ